MRNEHRHDQSEDYDYVGENIAATGEPHTTLSETHTNRTDPFDILHCLPYSGKIWREF